MIFAGLGNPGARYQNTRHNIGFWVIDLIAERWGRPDFRDKFRAEYAVGEAPLGGKHVLLKPQTFMNLSGESVQPALVFFKLEPSELIVIHDELDLPLGRLQLKVGGGSGGHNGLKSVTMRLGTPDYLRLRVGIGRPPRDFSGDVADFVLQAFAPSELEVAQKSAERAAEALELVLSRGLEPAMNEINRRSSS